jgi:CBS domain-containing protein
MRIKDVMTANVAQVLPTETIRHAKTLMRFHGVHHLVVVDGRLVKGVITTQQIAEAPQDGVSVKDVMTAHVVTAPPDLTVRKAANMLRGSAVAALPVVDRGRLVGIVTVADLLELIGRGVTRPVEKGKRWTLRHRGTRPDQARPVARR